MSQISLHIRTIREEDHNQWLPLWEGYQSFYQANIPPETTTLTWQRFLDPQEPMFAALAFEGEQAIGMVHFIYHRSCWTSGDYCYLQDLFVSPDKRGGGTGRQLIEFVYQTAQQDGCSRVHWLTHETNQDAMKLYDRIANRSGFVQYRKLL